MDNLTGKPKQIIAQPAKIVIDQMPDGQYRLTHNIVKPLYLIGILSTTLNNVINAAVQQEQMLIDPNRPRIVPGDVISDPPPSEPTEKSN